MPPALVIAGTHSGVGKTTLSLALMATLRQRGLRVQPFKVGPDFIDPGHHSLVCGRASRNLDTWMLPTDAVLSTFSHAEDADIAIIEGAMGLFDGRSAADPRGSTADVARLLGIPVILIVDASAVAASIAAVVKGFVEFDPQVRIVGVICNGVAGPRHYEYLAPAIRRHTSTVPLGWLPCRPEWEVPARHLGLITADEFGAGRWAALAQTLADTVDVEALLSLARPSCQPPVTRDVPARTTKRIAVARDAAFCFYYPENLELLGGEIVPFSPLNDRALPEGVDLVYLGGGYPELHAEQLAANHELIACLRRYHQQQGRTYAECGGLMYCCRDLVDGAGRAWPLLGLLPARTVMQSKRAALGYVTLRTTRASLLGTAATSARGHEFHYSRLETLAAVDYVAELDDGRGPPRLDVLTIGNLCAGYTHVHFGSNPQIAANLMGRP